MQHILRSERVLPLLNPVTIAVLLAAGGGLVYLQGNLAADKSGLSWLYLLMIVQVTPFLIAFTRRYYTYISFILMNHFVTFSAAKWNITKNTKKIGFLYPETVTSIQEMLICTLLMTGTYFIIRSLFFYEAPDKQKFLALSMSRNQMIGVAAYVALVPITLDYIPAQILIIHFALLAADMLLLMCSSSPRGEQTAAVLRLFVPVSCLMYFLHTGFLSMAGQYVAFSFITTCLRREYRRLTVIFAYIVVIMAVQTVKSDFRMIIRAEPEMTYVERTATALGLLHTKYFEEVESDDEEEANEAAKQEDPGLLGGFDRAGDDSLERVLSMTPSRVPFWGGETYATIPYLFIPRALWPEKPSRHFWNKFGRVYGYLSADDMDTSVGVGYFAEAYMNFGYRGLYIVAILMGIVIACVERMSIFFLGNRFYFTYIVFLVPILSCTADMTTMLASLAVLSGSLLLVRRFLMRLALRDDYV